MTPAEHRKGEARFRVPPASYWPQKHEAVWDEDGVTCDAEIEVVPADDKRVLDGVIAAAFRELLDGKVDAAQARLERAYQEHARAALDSVSPEQSEDG